MTYFALKQKPEHFIVTEILRQEPEGDGDYHYILFQKQGMTTMQVIEGLMRTFAFNRNMIGIAGLKDKHAITQQWMSIARRDVIKFCGGINGLLERFRKHGRVIDATYHDRPLKLGDNVGNAFEITLVPDTTFSVAHKKVIGEILTHITTKGVPNLFGEQRFGFGGANPYKGFSLLSGETRNIAGDNNTLTEKRFKVQAFASHVFNQYVIAREKQGLLYTSIPGDVLDRTGKYVTGPVPGDDLTYATEQAGRLEWEVFTAAGLDPEMMKRFKRFDLFGIRRTLVLVPQDMQYVWKGNNLVLSFILGSGSYATVVVSYLETLLAEKIGANPNAKEKTRDGDKKEKGSVHGAVHKGSARTKGSGDADESRVKKEKHVLRKQASKKAMKGAPARVKERLAKGEALPPKATQLGTTKSSATATRTSGAQKKQLIPTVKKPVDPVALAKHNHTLQERYKPNPNKKQRRFGGGKVAGAGKRTPGGAAKRTPNAPRGKAK